MPEDTRALVFSSTLNAGVPLTPARLTNAMGIPLNVQKTLRQASLVFTGLILSTEADVDQVFDFLSRSVQARCLHCTEMMPLFTGSYRLKASGRTGATFLACHTGVFQGEQTTVRWGRALPWGHFYLAPALCVLFIQYFDRTMPQHPKNTPASQATTIRKTITELTAE